jgi:hypothetical protein
VFILDPNFSIPDPSRVKKIADPVSGSASKNVSFFYPKIVSKLSEILSGMFIPGLDFLPFSDPGVKKAPDPGSGSANCQNST